MSWGDGAAEPWAEATARELAAQRDQALRERDQALALYAGSRKRRAGKWERLCRALIEANDRGDTELWEQLTSRVRQDATQPTGPAARPRLWRIPREALLPPHRVAARDAQIDGSCASCRRLGVRLAGAYCHTCRERGNRLGWCGCGAALFDGGGCRSLYAHREEERRRRAAEVGRGGAGESSRG